MDLMNQALAELVLRWVHFFAGIVWIGLLYYLNFVQGEFFKEADGPTKSNMIQKQLPRVLAWFRYGALFTFLSGAIIIGMRGGHVSMTAPLFVGALLGTLMFLNVWLVIWPNQKIVIASTTAVAGGGAALPEAATAGPKALLASRTNVLFSLPMLLFMGASMHFAQLGMFTEMGVVKLALVLAIIGALEANALFGKLSILATVKGVIHAGVGLALVLFGVLAFM